MKRFYLLPIVCCALSISLSAQENNGTATTSGADDNRILSADSLITTDARLDSLYQTLPEVMITGERPIVKAAQGKLVYDLPRLIQNLPVDNAYDAVKELPGVIEMNGGLQLAGQGVTVILDGKVTTLSTEQLYSLLRSIPASRIEKAEVMYNAPARYQVRGALINITLKQSVGGPGSWQGELYAKYRQKHNEGFYNPQIQISAESETKRSIFREKDKTKRSKKESAQHSKSRNKSFVMTSVSAL